MPKKISTFDIICKPLLKLKGIEKSTSYNTPTLKLKGKLLVRLREDNATIAIAVGLEDRDKLLRDQPEVFFLTDHYDNYPYVLARLSLLHPDELLELIKPQWQRMTNAKIK